ncbi:MAG: hypothetical protein AB1414_20390 [bacterium]
MCASASFLIKERDALFEMHSTGARRKGIYPVSLYPIEIIIKDPVIKVKFLFVHNQRFHKLSHEERNIIKY